MAVPHKKASSLTAVFVVGALAGSPTDHEHVISDSRADW